MSQTTVKFVAVLITALLLFPSCASIVSKTNYLLFISSTPSNAKIKVTDKQGATVFSGDAPATVSLRAGAGFFSKAAYMVEFSSDGFHSKSVPVHFTIDGWYFGNILFGGLIGMLIIDPATGAMWRIKSSVMTETLTPLVSSADAELKILDINDIPEEWKESLVRIDQK